MITRISGVIRPKGSDLIFDHPYNAEYSRLTFGLQQAVSAHRSASSGTANKMITEMVVLRQIVRFSGNRATMP